MADFNDNWRKKQELAGRGFADAIYRRWLGQHIDIVRYEREDGNAHVLDQHFAIDIVHRVSNGMILTGQEKFLSFKESRFNSLTVEYYNNPTKNVRGDWFHLAPQFYFCAYLNEGATGFCKGVIVDWLQIVLATHRGHIAGGMWHEQQNRYDGAMASFKWINFNNIPDYCILYRWDDNNRQKGV